ncbi:hypothetical protein B0H10DRAFT_1957165 [Mycena sp. CBHHK59/15]|nr:hypothetical protein B0H10DRAFT_1957165 [Mycena sp. CBHHK59/15]
MVITSTSAPPFPAPPHAQYFRPSPSPSTPSPSPSSLHPRCLQATLTPDGHTRAVANDTVHPNADDVHTTDEHPVPTPTRTSPHRGKEKGREGGTHPNSVRDQGSARRRPQNAPLWLWPQGAPPGTHPQWQGAWWEGHTLARSMVPRPRRVRADGVPGTCLCIVETGAQGAVCVSDKGSIFKWGEKMATGGSDAKQHSKGNERIRRATDGLDMQQAQRNGGKNQRNPRCRQASPAVRGSRLAES